MGRHRLRKGSHLLIQRCSYPSVQVRCTWLLQDSRDAVHRWPRSHLIYHKVPVAIVSEKLAREYWHNPSDALGKQVRANPKDDWREVVGVVAPTFTVMSPPGTTPDTTRVRVGTPSPGGAV